jgi:hypothetical protein
MNVESRLRAALQNTAELVEDRPRPLPLARRRNPMAMFAPIWVAVAVTAVVIASFVIRDQSRLGDPIPSSSPHAVSVGSAPNYYLAVYRATAGKASRVDVVSTATGEVLFVHAAGNNEDFVAVTSVPGREEIPKSGEKGVSSFYLLTRVGASGREGCGTYSIRDILMSPEGKFLQWGTHDLEFEARDNEQMLLATTKAGDEIAYTYRGCGDDEPLLAHRWAGTTTTWGSANPVTSLAYTSDGQSLIIGRQASYGKDDLQSVELWTMKTRDPGFSPESGRLLLTDNKDIDTLYHATISSDGTQVIALFQRTGSSTPLSVAEFSLKTGRTSRFLGWFDQQTIDLRQLSVDPDASGKNLLIRSWDRIVIMGAGYPTVIRTLTASDQPTDVAW